MIDQNGQTAPDQHRDKEEVEEVTVAHPQREAMRAGKVVGIDLRDRRNMGKSNQEDFQPCRKHGEKHQQGGGNQDGGANPDAKAAIGGIMNGGVCRIERDHCLSPGGPFMFLRVRVALLPSPRATRSGAVAPVLEGLQLLVTGP